MKINDFKSLVFDKRMILINLFFCFSLLLFLLTINELNSFIIGYAYLSLISTTLVIYSLFNRNATTLFLNLFFYLGFFFKISLITIFSQNGGDSIFFEESKIAVNFNSFFFNNLIIKVSIFFTFMLLSEIILFKKSKNKVFDISSIIKITNDSRIKIFFIILIFIILINLLNFNFHFTFRGKIEPDDIISNIIKSFNFFITSSIICLIIDFQNKNHEKKLLFLYLLIFSSIINHLTILSRSGVFEIILIIYIFYNVDTKKALFLLFITLLIWSFSVKGINFLRDNHYEFSLMEVSKQKIFAKNHEVDDIYNKSILTTNEKIENITKEIIEIKDNENNLISIENIKKNNFTYLLVYRWTGIDGFINTELNSNRSFDKLINAFKENYNYGVETFYEKEFFKIPSKNTYNQTFIPGYLAFFNYSGNDAILYMSAVFLVLILSIMNKIISFLIPNSIYFKNFLLYILIWRFIHFGIAPINTIKFIIVIIMYVVILRFLLLFLEKYRV